MIWNCFRIYQSGWLLLITTCHVFPCRGASRKVFFMPGKKYAWGNAHKTKKTTINSLFQMKNYTQSCCQILRYVCRISRFANMTKERKILIRINLGYSQCLFWLYLFKVNHCDGRERKKKKSRQTLEKCGILKNIDVQISLMANGKKKTSRTSKK